MNILRAVIGLFAIVALCWASVSFPIFRKISDQEFHSRRVIAGEPYRDGILAALMAKLDMSARGVGASASAARSRAVLAIRISEDGIGRTSSAGGQSESPDVRSSVMHALSLSPSDAFLWLALYTNENFHQGFVSDNIKYLKMSYDLGPREGWIARRRNRFAVAIFPELDDVVQGAVVAEFAGMVGSGLAGDATVSLSGPGWNIRDRLLAGLANVELVFKQAFARDFSRTGMKIVVPGMPEQEERPWR